jgi:hypothetical protein
LINEEIWSALDEFFSVNLSVWSKDRYASEGEFLSALGKDMKNLSSMPFAEYLEVISYEVEFDTSYNFQYRYTFDDGEPVQSSDDDAF